MKDLIETTDFYNDVMHTEKAIPEILQEIAIIGVKEEFDLLFKRFHERLNENFRTVRYNITEDSYQEKYDMPSKQFNRMCISAMMVNAMACGRENGEELYNDTINHIESIRSQRKPLN